MMWYRPLEGVVAGRPTLEESYRRATTPKPIIERKWTQTSRAGIPKRPLPHCQAGLRADVFHRWHRITLNELTSLQIEERLILRTTDEDLVDVEESAKYPSAPWMVRISGSHLLRLDGVDFHAFQPSEPVKSISLSKCPVLPTEAFETDDVETTR